MANEPTLRLGDQSVDGWVEYLQMLGAIVFWATLKITGELGLQ